MLDLKKGKFTLIDDLKNIKPHQIPAGILLNKSNEMFFNYITKSKPKNYYESKSTTAALLNVRNKPNGNIILYRVPNNTTVSVMKTKNNWTQIYNNRWVYSKYLK